MAYKIVYNKKGCIGAGECEALSPKLWKLQRNGKADLINSQSQSSDVFEAMISDDEAAAQKNVASSCPAGCIKVVKV